MLPPNRQFRDAFSFPSLKKGRGWGPPLRDHLWRGPLLPVTLRLIHPPPPKMTQGVMIPPNPPFITFNSILERRRKVLA
jgi:hypothetical protein